jgi:hypothetical protein
MQHRYILWEGHYRGRRWREMHIIGSDDRPICKTWKSASTEHETVWLGRPEGYSLCLGCIRERKAFEESERLRTWTEAPPAGA